MTHERMNRDEMSDTRHSAGRAFRSVRRAKEITLATVAERTGLSAAFVNQWERGMRTTTKPETLEALALAIGCDPLEMLTIVRRDVAAPLDEAIARISAKRPAVTFRLGGPEDGDE